MRQKGVLYPKSLSTLSIKIAEYEATKEALREAEFILLEPIMKLDIELKSEEISTPNPTQPHQKPQAF